MLSDVAEQRTATDSNPRRQSLEGTQAAGLEAAVARAEQSFIVSPSACDFDVAPDEHAAWKFAQSLDEREMKRAIDAPPDSDPAQPQIDEELSRLFAFTAGDAAALLLDPGGCVLDSTAAAGRLLGYPSGQLRGLDAIALFPEAGLTDSGYQRDLLRAPAAGLCESDRWCLRSDGVRFRSHNLTTSLRRSSGELGGFALILKEAARPRSSAKERLRAVMGTDLKDIRPIFASDTGDGAGTLRLVPGGLFGSLRERLRWPEWKSPFTAPLSQPRRRLQPASYSSSSAQAVTPRFAAIEDDEPTLTVSETPAWASRMKQLASSFRAAAGAVRRTHGAPAQKAESAASAVERASRSAISLKTAVAEALRRELNRLNLPAIGCVAGVIALTAMTILFIHYRPLPASASASMPALPSAAVLAGPQPAAIAEDLKPLPPVAPPPLAVASPKAEAVSPPAPMANSAMPPAAPLVATDPATSASVAEAPRLTGLPLIEVVDADSRKADDSITFRDWKMGDSGLSAIMTWHGGPLQDISFIARVNGVIKSHGAITIPGGDIKKDQPVPVEVSIGRKPTPDMIVAVEIIH